MKKLLRKYIKEQINEFFLLEAGESGSELGSLTSAQPNMEDQIQNIEDLQDITNKTIDANNETIKQIEFQKKNLELNKKRANQELKAAVPADPLTPQNAINTLKTVNNAKLKNIDTMQKDNVKKTTDLMNQNKDLEQKLADMENLQQTIQKSSTQTSTASVPTTPSTP